MKKIFLLSALLALLLSPACENSPDKGQVSELNLAEAFVNPPEEAKPWTWWHWVDGNITKEGISNDLEAMARAGLGGALIFNAKLGLPDGPVRFMKEDWLDMLDHATMESERLGLKLGFHNCDGWSQAGGPWITPEMSMKTLTWTKTEVEGPAKFSGTLPQPWVKDSPLVKDFYQDIAVLAYPAPVGERINGKGSGVSISGSLDPLLLQALVDEDGHTHASFPLGSSDNPEAHYVKMVFPETVSARSLIIHGIEGHSLAQVVPAKLEVSDNGTDFRELATLDLNWSYHESRIHTLSIAFPESRGRVFRISFKGEHIFQPAIEFSELELSTRPVLHYMEPKTGWASVREHGGEAPFLHRDPGPAAVELSLPENGVIPLEQVRKLSIGNSEDGSFEWEVPEGKWVLLRMGYTSTGRTNSPATDEGRGLEADKLDREAVLFHMDHFVGKLDKRYKERGLTSFSAFETDSWESGPQTWTAGLEKRFEAATGQDLLRWLPLLTEGVLIEGYEESNRLLWEWRRFMADQIAENYFQVTADFAEENNLTYVAESSGRQMFMYDPITYQRISPVPMGEFWVSRARGQWVRVDNRVAASAAHLSGKRYVASEAYTSPPESSNWTQTPFTLKSLGDHAFCEGVNKIIFHTYAHQARPDLKPGFTMGRWGMQNNSGNTWWNGPVEAWFDYLARCQYMLQEGRFHADILAYLGEEVPARLGRRHEFRPVIPPGYNYDGCDYHALFEARVEKGEILMPSGMRYKALLLPDKDRISLKVAGRIAELAELGALVIAPQVPEASPRFDELGQGDREVSELLGASVEQGKIHVLREGLESFLTEHGVAPDFSYRKPEMGDVLFIHRLYEGHEAYFLSNQKDRQVSIDAVFRQNKDMKVSLWDPATGKKHQAGAVKAIDGEGLELQVELEAYGAVFVVFSKKKVQTEPKMKELTATDYKGSWSLEFPEGTGAPEGILELDKLMDLSQHDDFGVRHFSGTMSYNTRLVLEEKDMAEGKHVLLDLGEVREMAEVLVNGERIEILWKPPFRTDITDRLQAGENQLEIRVTNLWVNRLIGDEYYPEEMTWKNASGTEIARDWPQWLLDGEERPTTERITWSSRKDYSKDDPLLSSGLLGPVQLIFTEEIK